ncbi:hypothetical protein EVAR_5506_1 [Eumeta japonica]|uniref:Uncharacterized protein n=1 Tax=Eumeta variegata TaxID=151549 RepID=A0A4C1T9Y2_EUMVA|nr:hypothetical protein EVAR_5506_1 [Eumeta japonica]
MFDMGEVWTFGHTCWPSEDREPLMAVVDHALVTSGTEARHATRQGNKEFELKMYTITRKYIARTQNRWRTRTSLFIERARFGAVTGLTCPAEVDRLMSGIILG